VIKKEILSRMTERSVSPIESVESSETRAKREKNKTKSRRTKKSELYASSGGYNKHSVGKGQEPSEEAIFRRLKDFTKKEIER